MSVSGGTSIKNRTSYEGLGAGFRVGVQQPGSSPKRTSSSIRPSCAWPPPTPFDPGGCS